jgi:hypothetical protein
MKTGTVKYSAEFRTIDGFSRWAGIELQYDMGAETFADVYARAVNELTHAITPKGVAPISNSPAPPTEIPVINKAEERLGILIENAATKEELMTYKDSITTPYLADLFSSKHQQLFLKQ